ncbi:MAG: hypothetical protein IKV62_10735 [Bacteroidales bacterium]|nr:hypothetical protein [Bacteroidales bacterium]
MKRLLVVCAASLLPCFLVSAQEADNSGRSVELSVIPRLDLNPTFSTVKGGGAEFTLGNTSLYSLFEGNLTENLSFSVCNHWAAFDSVQDVLASTTDLYKGTLYSDTTNWLDWANLTYTFGNFALTVGKDMVTTGGLEFDDYDFEVHPALVSSFWQNFSCYQWGAKLAFTTPAESDAISFQFTTSPFGERPFASKLFNYSVEWRGEHGPLETIWSATAVGNEGEYQPIFALGQRLNFDSWTVGFDAFSVVGDEEDILRKGITLMPSVTFSPSEKFDILAKGGYENYALETVEDGSVKRLWGGLACHWYPLRDSRDLRVHAVAAYDNSTSLVSLTLGLLYNISIF